MRDGWTAGFATWGDEDWIGRAPCLLVANMSSAFSGLQGDTPMSCVDGCPSHGTALPGALQKALGAQRMDPSTVIAECGQKKESARAHSFLGSGPYAFFRNERKVCGTHFCVPKEASGIYIYIYVSL